MSLGSRRLVGRVTASVVALGLVGCALVGCALLVDTEDLTGGQGPDGGDAAVGQIDGLPLVDARTDPEPSDAGTPFCKNGLADGADFCDDFDERPVGFDWDPPSFTEGASRTLDRTGYVSPPNALVFDVPVPTKTVSNTIAWQAKRFPTVAQIDCAFDVEVLKTLPGSSAAIGMIETNGRATAGRATIRVFATVPSTLDSGEVASSVDVGGAITRTTAKLSRWPTSGRFTRLTLRLNLDGNSSLARVSLDGAEVGTLSIPAYLERNYALCGIGIPFVTDAKGGWRTRVDNVAISVVPN